MRIELMNSDENLYGFNYPESIKKAVELELTNICPWRIIDKCEAAPLLQGLKKRHPRKKYIPFAVRQDNDDIACFEADSGEEVLIVHDFASSGWELRRKYRGFWDWFKAILDDMIYNDY